MFIIILKLKYTWYSIACCWSVVVLLCSIAHFSTKLPFLLSLPSSFFRHIRRLPINFDFICLFTLLNAAFHCFLFKHNLAFHSYSTVQCSCHHHLNFSITLFYIRPLCGGGDEIDCATHKTVLCWSVLPIDGGNCLCLHHQQSNRRMNMISLIRIIRRCFFVTTIDCLVGRFVSLLFHFLLLFFYWKQKIKCLRGRKGCDSRKHSTNCNDSLTLHYHSRFYFFFFKQNWDCLEGSMWTWSYLSSSLYLLAGDWMRMR